MDNATRDRLIALIVKREALRPLGRLERLLRKPLRTLPYYILAAFSRIRPFKMSFKTLWGTRMASFLPEGNTFYYYGYCEANLANFFLRYVKEGFICIDIGAHVGYYSMLLSELVGDTGEVHAFEPTPWTYMLLKENTRTLSQVTANNLAISDTKETLEFSDYGPGYGAYNTAHERGAANLDVKAEPTRVESIALDAYVASFSKNPDIVKIDAEGFEYRVLSGMCTLLANTSAPRPLITLEVAGDETWRENLEQSFAFLLERGYVPYDITIDGMLVTHTSREHYTYDNLLFVPNERLSELMALRV